MCDINTMHGLLKRISLTIILALKTSKDSLLGGKESLYLADFKDYITATETTTVLLITQLLSSRLLRIKFAFVEGFVTRM